jgi:hypothetical protein
MARVPIIHQSAAEQMTANVLKRIDPDIEEVGVADDDERMTL